MEAHKLLKPNAGDASGQEKMPFVPNPNPWGWGQRALASRRFALGELQKQGP